MKKILILFQLVSAVFQLAAQAPQQFSFQGVARSDGKALPNATIKLRLTIHSETPAGTIKYQETHTSQTNVAGIFNVMVGTGSVTSGEWKMLDWKEYNYFLQVETDITGGGSYVDIGTTQLASVPFAMYSAEAARWQNGYPVVQKMELSPDIDINSINDINDPRLKPYSLPALGEGATLLWYPMKGAFRAGNPGNGAWDSIISANFPPHSAIKQRQMDL